MLPRSLRPGFGGDSPARVPVGRCRESTRSVHGGRPGLRRHPAHQRGPLGYPAGVALEQHRRDPGLLLNYSELPGAVQTRLLDAFGIVASAEDAGRMQAATRFDAKNPPLPFEDDTEAKDRAAAPA